MAAISHVPQEQDRSVNEDTSTKQLESTTYSEYNVDNSDDNVDIHCRHSALKSNQL